MSNQNNSSGQKSNVEHMLDLLALAGNHDEGFLSISVQDILSNPGNYEFSAEEFLRRARTLVNVGLFRESLALFWLEQDGINFINKLNVDDVCDKIVADIAANKNLQITDVIRLVNRYHQDIIDKK